MLQPSGQSFADWMQSRVALKSTRSYDWDALKFQADFDPKYRRIFFVLRGNMKVICEKDGERWEVTLGERDLISVPPGVYREEQNIGDEDALMCVMLGTPKPITPMYPPDSPLSKIKR
ncbi:MAG: cupin domain-containing protein [Betaproteobacteria bacterium]|nr:cupin domain-containing protein [Betaproteobacteria bacterium]